MEKNQIKENVHQIWNNIRKACEKSGQSSENITLVAVSKTVEADTMNAAIQSGLTAFGENRVQEIRRKYDSVEKGPAWHLIGHLQTNKVKYIIDKVDMIQSVDSVRLAKEISKRAVQVGRIVEILIQINVAEEAQKFGISSDQLPSLLNEISSLPGIIVKGLMLIAPYSDDPETVRPFFRKMKDIFDSTAKEKYDNVDMTYLSMGMTGDYQVAIEEGANMVRIGSGVFGLRSY